MDSLASKLYNSIREADEVRVFERWHASSIADCPRTHYLKRLGSPRISEPGAGKMLRWRAGHLMEESIRPHILAVFPDATFNQRLESEELDLTGEYDCYSEAEEAIIEIKSVHDFAFAYQKKGEGRFHIKGEVPYLNHELQNHCYVKLLREAGKSVKYIIYVYITLDGRIATYKTEVKEELLANVERRLEVLNEAWRTKTPPPCICLDESHPLYKPVMRYCDYNNGNKCCEIKGE